MSRRKLDSKEHTDLTVVSCDFKEYPLHTVVLCSQSEFFAGLMKNDWKVRLCSEGSEGLFDTEQEKKTRNIGPLDETATELDQLFPLLYGEAVPASTTLDELVEIYKLADKCLCSGVLKQVEDWVREFAPSPWTSEVLVDLLDLMNNQCLKPFPKLKRSISSALDNYRPGSWGIKTIKEALKLVANKRLSSMPGLEDLLLDSMETAMSKIASSVRTSQEFVQMLGILHDKCLSSRPKFKHTRLDAMRNIPESFWDSEEFVKILNEAPIENLSFIPDLKELILDKMKKDIP